MGYKKAAEILPDELLKAIQRYVDAQYIYVPRKKGGKKPWGSGSNIKEYYKLRNAEIYSLKEAGKTVKELSLKYHLCQKTIYKIIASMKEK